MGKVIILSETTKNPISLMGKMSGICYGANVEDELKNYNRGMDCLQSNHGRVLEYPQVYFKLEGYSARVIREFYTHIGGAPTRLQESTRYINYQSGFNFIVPDTILENPRALDLYNWEMDNILYTLRELEKLGIPKEDSANLLPLGMTSDIVVRTNARNLIDMSRQRECQRAYWEFRELFNDLKISLSNYSEQWKYIADNHFMPKCKALGYCPEKKSCKKS